MKIQGVFLFVTGLFFALRVEDKTIELIKTLQNNNIETKGQPFLMRYNDPWTPPFLRRNEVAIEVNYL